MKYIKEYAKYHRGEIDKKGNKISSKEEKLFDFLEDLGFEKKEITRTSFGQEIKNFVFQKDGIVIVLPTQDLEERHYSLARHTLISSDLIDNKKDFEMIFESHSGIDLSIELEHKLRNLPDDSKLTVDDFVSEFGVSPTSMTDFAWASILKNAQKYKNMSDEEFEKVYNEYKSNITEDDEDDAVEEYDDYLDLQFAMAKIKDHFDEDKVIGMFDDEVLEWVDSDWEDEYESEYDWYVDHNNGEAQDSVITQIINWYKKEFNKTLNTDEHSELFDAIKSEYDCLNY